MATPIVTSTQDRTCYSMAHLCPQPSLALTGLRVLSESGPLYSLASCPAVPPLMSPRELCEPARTNTATSPRRHHVWELYDTGRCLLQGACGSSRVFAAGSLCAVVFVA